MSAYKFVNNILNKNKKINVFNKGSHSRDFTYIDDVVNAIYKIIKSKKIIIMKFITLEVVIQYLLKLI